MQDPEQTGQISPIGKLVLLMGSNLVLMAGSSLSPGLPAIRETFQHVPGIFFWTSMVLTLPALIVVLSGPVTGIMVDRFGRKPILIGSLIIGGLGGESGCGDAVPGWCFGVSGACWPGHRRHNDGYQLPGGGLFHR